MRARLYALEQLRSQMIIAVDDYEFELFLKVKSLVAWHMMPRRQQVMNKITTADKLLAQLKKVGNIQQYTFVVRQAEKLQQQLILYDRIREASSFGQLIPPLKLYFQ